MADELFKEEEEPTPEPAAAIPESAGELPSEVEPPPVEETQEEVDLRAAASQAGYDLSGYADDSAALSHLIERANQAQFLQDQVEQNRHLMSQMLASNRQEPQPEPEKPPQFWNAPDYDQYWLTQVQRAEDGSLEPIPGASPEVVDKLQNYMAYQQAERAKFWQNPFDYIKPFVEHVSQQTFESQAPVLRSGISEEQQASQFIRDNGDWLFSAGIGTPLSDEGKLFNDSLTRYASMNLPSSEQQALALRDVEVSRLQKQYQELSSKTTASESAEEKKKQTLRDQAGFNPNHAGTIDQRANPATGEAPPQNPQQTLAQMMEANLKAAGIGSKELAENF